MSGFSDGTSDTPPVVPLSPDAARFAVGAPAALMMMNGILGLVILGLISVPAVFDPDLAVEGMKEWAAEQPPGPERQENEQKIAEFENQLNQERDSYVIRNAVVLGGAALLNLTAIVGGLFMRSLSGYRISMIGGIASVIPLATGCCVSGIPFGIWVLMTLNRPEIKAAFAARIAPPPDPDAQYMK